MISYMKVNYLDESMKEILMKYVENSMTSMVDSYIYHCDKDLDMDTFGLLKSIYDALRNNYPLNTECRIYLKTVAANQLGIGFKTLSDLVDDIPTLKSEVDCLTTWYNIAKNI